MEEVVETVFEVPISLGSISALEPDRVVFPVNRSHLNYPNTARYSYQDPCTLADLPDLQAMPGKKRSAALPSFASIVLTYVRRFSPAPLHVE